MTLAGEKINSLVDAWELGGGRSSRDARADSRGVSGGAWFG